MCLYVCVVVWSICDVLYARVRYVDEYCMVVVRFAYLCVRLIFECVCVFALFC